MPVISSGNNATINLGPSDVLSVQAGGSFAQLECPVGKVIAQFSGSRDFGQLANGPAKLTSIQGAIYYEFNEVDQNTSVLRDLPTGALLSRGNEIGGGSNFSDGILFCDWQPANGVLSLVSANAGEAAALDPAVTCDGMPMAGLTLGAAGTLIADYVFAAPAYLAQMQSLQIPIRVSTNNTAFVGANPIQIWLMSDAGGSQQWRLASSLDMTYAQSGITTTLSFGPGAASDGWAFAQSGGALPTSTTDMDAVTIYKIRIVMAVPGGVAGQRCWFGPIRMNARRKPVVSLVLDGQYSSQHNYILPMLEAQGLRCSLAIQGSLIGAGGRMTRAQLDRAYGAGHEIISWGYDPKTSAGYQLASDWPDQASITADIIANQQLMASYGWTRGIAYAVHGGSTHSFGGTVPLARQQMIAAAFRTAGVKAIRSGQGVGTLSNRLQSVARPANVDAYSIQGALQWASTDNAASLNAVTTRAKARGEWGVITGHRSVVAGPVGVEVLNSDLLTWAQSLGDDVRGGRVQCLPFAEAARYLGIVS